MNTRSRRFKGLIAGAAGAALLLGGSTYALWSASATRAGGVITAGNLDVWVPDGSQVVAWDVSPDRSDQKANLYTGDCFASTVPPRNAHAIVDLANYTVTPKDEIALVFPFDIALQGDNLVATLSLDAVETEFNLDGSFWWYFNDPAIDKTETDARADEAAETGITVAAYTPGDIAVPTPQLVTWAELLDDPTITIGELVSDVKLGTYQAQNEPAGTDDPGIPTVDPTGTEVCVVMTVQIPNFDLAAGTEAALLDGLKVGVKLEQTRDAGVGWFTAP